jgi:hypothetical protein
LIARRLIHETLRLMGFRPQLRLQSRKLRELITKKQGGAAALLHQRVAQALTDRQRRQRRPRTGRVDRATLSAGRSVSRSR